MIRRSDIFLGHIHKRVFSKKAVRAPRNETWEKMKWVLGLAIAGPYIAYVLKDRIQFHRERRAEIELERAESARIRAEIDCEERRAEGH